MEAMSSRRLAQTWLFPRHKIFEQQLRLAASGWFDEKGFPTHAKIPYCLKDWGDWNRNIILDEVSSYVETVRRDCGKDGRPFPLHKYIHHGLSSQAMAFNLIGPLITRNDYSPLIRLLQKKGIEDAWRIVSASFEYEDRSVFNEDSGQPTSIDVVLRDKDCAPIVFMESKLSEKEFGGCSVFVGGDCGGANPIANKEQCYLHFIGRKYWSLMGKYGFDALLQQERQCVFVAHYQFFREVLLSLEKGGVFVLLSDARSPVFHCQSNEKNGGLMPFLLTLVPEHLRKRILSISVQELTEEIKVADTHQDWIGNFERKYGLTKKH